ncbi:MAG: hypothetical protein WC867_01615 [Candidatus Pacearchaeota archaeon]|jgi:hypothetical protein
MGKKQIYILFALAFVLFGISVYIYFNESSDKKEDFDDNIEYKKVDNTLYSSDIIDSNNSNSTSMINSTSNSPSSITPSGSSGSENTPSNPISPPIQKSLPSDISTSPCGFYYQGYEVCTGYCAVGSCISEGRSCYCKIV